MVFTGLSIQIARLRSQNKKGTYLQDKNTCAGILAGKWEEGLNASKGASLQTLQ